MTGMNRTTGKALSGIEHIRQSVVDILTTPVGSRVMRRDYGSLLPELIDAPLNGTTRQLLIGATVDALIKWEPRINVQQVQPQLVDGNWQLAIDASLADGTPVQLDVNLARGMDNG